MCRAWSPTRRRTRRIGAPAGPRPSSRWIARSTPSPGSSAWTPPRSAARTTSAATSCRTTSGCRTATATRSSTTRAISPRRSRARLRAEGVYRGIGISGYAEGTAIGPYEGATVKLDLAGRVIVATGAVSSGQGHETSFAQIAADALGVPLDWVTVIGGDTAAVPFGVGTFASRSAVTAGNSIAEACREVRAKLARAAASLLEAGPEDVEIEDGKAFVRGTPGSAVDLARVIHASIPTFARPGVAPPDFEASAYHHVPTVTWASAVHVAQVEVDTTTGGVKLLRYVVAHDCGRVINPIIVDGQVHGGVAQGVGGALLEDMAYDEHGQLLAGSLMDYAIPKAGDLPLIETVHLG